MAIWKLSSYKPTYYVFDFTYKAQKFLFLHQNNAIQKIINMLSM